MTYVWVIPDWPDSFPKPLSEFPRVYASDLGSVTPGMQCARASAYRRIVVDTFYRRQFYTSRLTGQLCLLSRIHGFQ